MQDQAVVTNHPKVMEQVGLAVWVQEVLEEQLWSLGLVVPVM